MLKKYPLHLRTAGCHYQLLIPIKHTSCLTCPLNVCIFQHDVGYLKMLSVFIIEEISLLLQCYHRPARKLTNLVMLIKCHGTCLFLLLLIKYTWTGERTQSSRQGVQASTIFSKHKGRSGSSVYHDSSASCTIKKLLCRMKHKPIITLILMKSSLLWSTSRQLISLLICCWKTMRFRKRQFRKCLFIISLSISYFQFAQTFFSPKFNKVADN